MAVAANYFYNSGDSDAQTLLRRIRPSDEQIEEQQERWNELRDSLISQLQTKSGYSINSWLQGSYKFFTQIRPVRKADEFDIDLGVYYQWDGSTKDGDFTPKEFRDFVQSSLLHFANTNSSDVEKVAPKKTRCCRIHYKNKFHIDVPVYHLNPKSDKRSLATDAAWEDSDPKAIYIWFRNSFDDAVRARVRRQVMYLKSWAALKFKEDSGRPSSILLTVLVTEAMKLIPLAHMGPDDELLCDLLEIIVKRLESNLDVKNPVDSSENLNRLPRMEGLIFLSQLKSMLHLAKQACTANDVMAAVDKWQEIFEHLFPMPPAPISLLNESRSLQVTSFDPQIQVVATAKNNPAGRFEGINKIGPIPIDCDLVFTLQNTNCLPPYSSVHWMVRNEGRDAENVNDLGHKPKESTSINGIMTVKESSLYRGTHHMDCIVKQHGQIIGIRRVPVVISGAPMPLRNPPKKVKYVIPR